MPTPQQCLDRLRQVHKALADRIVAEPSESKRATLTTALDRSQAVIDKIVAEGLHKRTRRIVSLTAELKDFTAELKELAIALRAAKEALGSAGAVVDSVLKII